MKGISVKLTCFSCGEVFFVFCDNEDQFKTKLVEYNEKILEAFDNSLTELPEDFTFCIICIKTKKKLFDQEIHYLSKSAKENAEKVNDYNIRVSTQKNGIDKETKKYNPEALTRYEKEKQVLHEEIEKYESQYTEIEEKIKKMMENAEKFEDEHNEIIQKINVYENDILKLQKNIKLLSEKKNLYDRRLEALKKFSVLNEVFRIKLFETYGTINGLEIGVTESKTDIDWLNANAAFGNLMLLLNYIIKKNSIDLADIDIIPFGNNSYFYNKTYDKKYKFLGPIEKDNLEIFNQALRYLVSSLNCIKFHFENYFTSQKINMDMKDDIINSNINLNCSDILFKLDKKTYKQWSKNMKVVFANFYLIIYYQEKKDEHEFLEV